MKNLKVMFTRLVGVVLMLLYLSLFALFGLLVYFVFFKDYPVFMENGIVDFYKAELNQRKAVMLLFVYMPVLVFLLVWANNYCSRNFGCSTHGFLLDLVFWRLETPNSTENYGVPLDNLFVPLIQEGEIKGLFDIFNKLSLKKEALQEKIEFRERYFVGQTKKWQESDIAIEYSEKTYLLTEYLNKLTNELFVLNDCIHNLNNLEKMSDKYVRTINGAL